MFGQVIAHIIKDQYATACKNKIGYYTVYNYFCIGSMEIGQRERMNDAYGCPPDRIDYFKASF